MKISTVHPDYPPRPTPPQEIVVIPGEGKLRVARRILWIVACFEMIAAFVLVMMTPAEVDGMIASALEEKRMSLYTVQAAPEAMRADFDRTRDATILRVRMWHGCDVLVGAITLACAIKLRRRPVPLAVTALALFFFTTAVAIRYQLAMPAVTLGVRMLVLAALTAALMAAVAGRQESLAAAKPTSA